MSNPLADQLAAKLRDAGVTAEVRALVMYFVEAYLTEAAEIVERARADTTATPQDVGCFLRNLASSVHDIGTA